MNYKKVEKYTPAMEKADYIVFLKTDFKDPILNAKGKVVGWKRTPDNYVYGIFPNRRTTRTGMMCASYAAPDNQDVRTWKDKLPLIETTELDALAEDVPATKEEFSALLEKLVRDRTVSDGVIVIEDASTWQKLGAARRRVYRRQIEDIISPQNHAKENYSPSYPTIYSLAM